MGRPFDYLIWSVIVLALGMANSAHASGGRPVSIWPDGPRVVTRSPSEAPPNLVQNPPALLVTAADMVLVQGDTLPNTSVTVNGELLLKVRDSGRFFGKYPLSHMGFQTIQIEFSDGSRIERPICRIPKINGDASGDLGLLLLLGKGPKVAASIKPQTTLSRMDALDILLVDDLRQYFKVDLGGIGMTTKELAMSGSADIGLARSVGIVSANVVDWTSAVSQQDSERMIGALWPDQIRSFEPASDGARVMQWGSWLLRLKQIPWINQTLQAARRFEYGPDPYVDLTNRGIEVREALKQRDSVSEPAIPAGASPPIAQPVPTNTRSTQDVLIPAIPKPPRPTVLTVPSSPPPPVAAQISMRRIMSVDVLTPADRSMVLTQFPVLEAVICYDDGSTRNYRTQIELDLGKNSISLAGLIDGSRSKIRVIRLKTFADLEALRPDEGQKVQLLSGLGFFDQVSANQELGLTRRMTKVEILSELRHIDSYRQLIDSGHIENMLLFDKSVSRAQVLSVLLTLEGSDIVKIGQLSADWNPFTDISVVHPSFYIVATAYKTHILKDPKALPDYYITRADFLDFLWNAPSVASKIAELQDWYSGY